MNSLLSKVGIFTLLVLAISLVLVGDPASAVTPISPGELPKPRANEGAVGRVLAIVNGLVGAIALLVIVVSGLRYITSGGDPQKAANAKNGVIYALAGVAIVLAADAIVVFVARGLG